MKKFFLIVIFLIGTFSFGQRSDFESIPFSKADSIAHYFKGASLKNLPVLVHNLTSDLPTDVEKFRSIYTWVCTNIKNDYSAFQKTVKKRKKLFENQEALKQWNNEYTPKVFKNLLKYKKTSCTGYAFLVREMANLAGIKCTIVNGYSRTPTLILNEDSIPNHSWNAVELEGKWYLCDPTWSAGKIFIDNDGARFEASYFDGYFLADPELFVKNHFPLEEKWILTATPASFKDFMDGPVVYKEAFDIGIIPMTPIKMHLEVLKNEQLTFTINSPKVLKEESILLVLNNGNSSKNSTPKITRNQIDYQLQHTFEKAGRYDVHIKVNDTIMATYVVKVKRK